MGSLKFAVFWQFMTSILAVFPVYFGCICLYFPCILAVLPVFRLYLTPFSHFGRSQAVFDTF